MLVRKCLGRSVCVESQEGSTQWLKKQSALELLDNHNLVAQVAADAGPPPVDCFMTELSGLLECPQVRHGARLWCCAWEHVGVL